MYRDLDKFCHPFKFTIACCSRFSSFVQLGYVGDWSETIDFSCFSVLSSYRISSLNESIARFLFICTIRLCWCLQCDHLLLFVSPFFYLISILLCMKPFWGDTALLSDVCFLLRGLCFSLPPYLLVFLFFGATQHY